MVEHRVEDLWQVIEPAHEVRFAAGFLGQHLQVTARLEAPVVLACPDRVDDHPGIVGGANRVAEPGQAALLEAVREQEQCSPPGDGLGSFEGTNEGIVEGRATAHLKRLCESYARLTGRRLIEECPESELIGHMDRAPFALVSHGTGADPVFNYGNATALALFGMTWDEFIALPSRYSAEQPDRAERERLLRAVKTHGYVDDYSGVRIAKDGRRFMIEQATVWSVIDEDGSYFGQAAVFSRWHEVA